MGRRAEAGLRHLPMGLHGAPDATRQQPRAAARPIDVVPRQVPFKYKYKNILVTNSRWMRVKAALLMLVLPWASRRQLKRGHHRFGHEYGNRGSCKELLGMPGPLGNAPPLSTHTSPEVLASYR